MFSDLAPSARHSARPRVGGNGERKRKREMEGPTTDNFAVAFFTGEIANKYSDFAIRPFLHLYLPSA